MDYIDNRKKAADGNGQTDITDTQVRLVEQPVLWAKSKPMVMTPAGWMVNPKIYGITEALKNTEGTDRRRAVTVYDETDARLKEDLARDAALALL